jgi:hypothetical protein
MDSFNYSKVSNQTKENVKCMILDEKGNTYQRMLKAGDNFVSKIYGNYHSIYVIPLDERQNSCTISRNALENPKFVIEKKFGRLEIRKKNKCLNTNQLNLFIQKIFSNLNNQFNKKGKFSFINVD